MKNNETDSDKKKAITMHNRLKNKAQRKNKSKIKDNEAWCKIRNDVCRRNIYNSSQMGITKIFLYRRIYEFVLLYSCDKLSSSNSVQLYVY